MNEPSEEILIVDDPVIEPEVVIEDKQPKNVATEDELAALKAQLAGKEAETARLTQRVDEEARKVVEANNGAYRAIEDKFEANEVAIANALSAHQNEVEALTRQIETLYAEGKPREIADATRKLARIETAILQAEQAKAYNDEQRANFRAQQEAARRAPPPAPQVSPRAKAWIDAHPRFATDSAYRDAALGAHNLAKLRGIAADTDEYFEFIEEQLGERKPVMEDNPAPRRSGTSSAAPPSRSTATPGVQTRQQRLTLNAQEREMADISMSYIKEPQERYKRYALNKQKMMAENPLQYTG